MAEIRRYPFLRHLRADASAHVLHFRGTRLVRAGRGLSFWFRPLTDSVAEVPADDRELTLVVHGRSADFQDVAVQGLVTYRVLDPVKLAGRVDFSVDPRTGLFLRQPLEKLAQALSQLAQQHASDYLALTALKQVLAEGQVKLRESIEAGLTRDPNLPAMGLAVVSVRITSVKPNPELEKALEAPMRERIKQEADEAAFQRRAQAVEKERAIQENELQNRIELAKREEQLITQLGANTRRTAQEKAEADAIALQSQVQGLRTKAEAEAQNGRLKADTEAKIQALRSQSEAEAQRVKAAADAYAEKARAEAQADAIRATSGVEAEGIRVVEGARVEAERARLEAFAGLPPQIMLGLALKELAGKLHRIDHLNLGSEVLGGALVNLLEAGTAKLKAPKEV